MSRSGFGSFIDGGRAHVKRTRPPDPQHPAQARRSDRLRHLRGNTWIIDLSHHLTTAGAIADMPARARMLAEYLASTLWDGFAEAERISRHNRSSGTSTQLPERLQTRDAVSKRGAGVQSIAPLAVGEERAVPERRLDGRSFYPHGVILFSQLFHTRGVRFAPRFLRRLRSWTLSIC